MIGQFIGRHLVGIVHATNDDGLVGIAFEEIDDHFLANARDVNHAPLSARPRSPNANPAGAAGILLSLAVPVELHLHATVFVREDFFSRRPHHGRRVRAVHERLRGRAQRAKGQCERDAREYVAVVAVAIGRASPGADSLLRHVTD